ncbi:serine/threonine-protein kinase [Mycolicibacter sinensis]|jgi:serine/threonine-protein kinase|uniref:non-specific serine/threonine protein kinase n=1 Tax=Mycolicibacter sinensis (strain JDM601) TaxID=875328 RepID=A0A1A2DT21_MYCSD|nr:serine/threonine-protein kinase [Mycolicibacter sinensis]OBF96372.1 protein kinase [Mycolicibacter sinensis]OBG06328.1 protein kinase [Mycolicibacter sinensis]
MGEAGGDFGGYLIGRAVGRGGHATVYRAHHPEDDPGTPVALKILDESHRTPVEQARLDREFEFARVLDHPNVVTVYRHGPCWLAMQFVDGGKSTGLQTLPDQLAALAQIADALDYAHHRGIVHCDVKPANILVPADFPRTGVVLTDFGSAHAVVEDVWSRPRRPGSPEVSLPYTAPEILCGKAPSAATDEYALACTAVELLTGAPPFPADNAAELVDAHLRRLPPPVSAAFGPAGRALDVVVERAMAKLPARRYNSCTEFVGQLSRVLATPPGPET